jgi:hypothetical protein
MSFTYVLTTDIGKIRLIISDKTSTDYHFSDEELQVFLTSEGSINLAAAAALESWAAAYALNADNERIGDYSYAQSTSDKMIKLATSLRAADAAVPSITWAEPDLLGTDEGDTE